MLKSSVDMLLALAKDMCVIIVLAYVLTRTRPFTEVLQRHFTRQNRLFLLLILGIFSIYGTLGGVGVMGAVANLRDLGPLIAGLIGGPLVGIGAGIIGGGHRMLLGGVTAMPCGLATILAGLVGGIIFVAAGRKMVGVWPAVIAMAGMEAFHMGLVLVIARPFETALAIVQQVSLPMIGINALGMGIFMFITRNVMHERATASAKRLIEGELQAAHDIQMSILPKIFPPFPTRGEFELYCLLVPAKEVGGDLYDFYELDEDRLFFVIGDVSGKGVPAALFMAISMTLFKLTATQGHSPEYILATVNDLLSQGNDACMFVTSICGILDTRSGEVVFANGGHNPPMLLKADGGVTPVTCSRGMVVGAMEGMTYSLDRLELQAGDTLFLYTDGVTEAMNHADDLYGDERMIARLETMPGVPVQALAEGVRQDIQAFVRGADQSDDITIMALRYLGRDPSTPA